MMHIRQIKNILETALMVAGEPLDITRLNALFAAEQEVTVELIHQALVRLKEDYQTRGLEVKEIASGYTIQVKQDLLPWIKRLWPEKVPRYSKALLETLAIIAYHQPITRGEIEAVRGVAVNTTIIRSLLEREWIQGVGHREVPGRPNLYATTRQFLDYFNLKKLDELPSLAQLRNVEELIAAKVRVTQPIAASIQLTEDAPL